jgi:hypothetical protein
MKAILYDVLLIIVGIILIAFRDFYATLGQKAKTPEERAELARTWMYRFKVWNAIIVGAGFLSFGSYLLYVNLLKYFH